MHNHGPKIDAKAKDMKQSLLALRHYLKPHMFFLILAILLSVVGSITMILGPRYLGDITAATTDFVKGFITREEAASLITRLGFILIGIYSASAISNYFCGFFMTGVTQKVSKKMREDISHKINKIPLNYFDTTNFGDVLSRVTNDVDLVSQNLNQALTQTISSVTLFIGVFIMMLTINFYMTLIALVSIPLSLLVMIVIVKYSQKYFKRQQKALGNLNGHIEEAFAGHTVIKAFNQEDNQYSKFSEMNDELRDSAQKSQFFSGLMMPIMQFIGNLSYVAICILGGILIVLNPLVYGLELIQMFIQYTRLLNQPIQQLGQIANVLQSCAAASERVIEFLALEEMPEDDVKYVLSKDEVKGEVVFKDVNFGYLPNKQIIFDFSSEVKPGMKIAIVGPTGAGKTTIVNLLMRFYEVNSGHIYIDGHDTKELSRGNVADLFGMVLQDTWLFEGTIRDNLKYGNPSATDEQIYMALEACHIDHFVKSLPGGLDYVLDENANVSQGQKQLLTIARTMIENAPMLILDEATSSVDTRTEALIQRAMDKLMNGRTSFVIAHRLSTIKNADMILVLKDGNIIEQGNHETLLEQGGFYASLYNSQFEL